MSASELIGKLEAALPIPTRVTPELQSTIRRGEASFVESATCNIKSLFDMGEEGGIVCELDLRMPDKEVALVSITHLRFDARLPLYRDITAYQKRRLKQIRRQRS